VRRGGALFNLPLLAITAPCHIGFALGAAARALDEIVAVARTKPHMWTGGTLGERGSFQRDLGHAQAQLAAARLLGFDAVGTIWRAALENRALSLQEGAAMRAAMVYTTDIAAEVVTLAYRHAGAAAIHNGNPLQRYLRDMLAATQHVAVTDDAYEYAGRAALGMGPVHPTLAPRPPL
jgi:alkylation response protein AidB-like acyl-CoA dehydrogenase